MAGAMRQLRTLALAAAAASLALPATVRAVSSLSVSVAPGIVSAPTTVSFTMASTDVPLPRFATAGMRLDTGRPCEGTLGDFQATVPPVNLGTASFAQGTVTQPANSPRQPGTYRLCAYLTGTSVLPIVIVDQLFAVRLPSGTAALTLDPAAPAFGTPVTLRVAGNVDVPATVDVLGGAGTCANAESVTDGSQQVAAGAYSVSFPGLRIAENVTRLCVRVTPSSLLDAPNDGLALASVDQPFAQDLGASIGAVRATMTGRRIEASAPVSGAFRGPVTIQATGVDCGGDPAARVRAGTATAVCLVRHSQRMPATTRVRLAGRSRLGADLASSTATVDITVYRRDGRLVVPDRSIGVLRLGMTVAELLRQGGQGSALGFTPGRKLILPQTIRDRHYGLDGAVAVVRGGRVRALFTRGTGDKFDDFHLAHGLKTSSSPKRSGLRRLAPGGRCRPFRDNRSLSDLCRFGRSTFWGPGGGTSLQVGFFAIWPGTRVR
jgi:hypothetical protein